MSERKFHIRKNDKVMVIAGKEKGKIGTVLKMITKKERAIVEKLNIVKRHTKAGPKSAKGGIILILCLSVENVPRQQGWVERCLRMAVRSGFAKSVGRY